MTDLDAPAQLVAASAFGPADLSFLRAQHAPVDEPVCPVCGGAMTIARAGGGDATDYRCATPQARWLQPDPPEGALEHWRASLVRVGYHGDSQIVALIDELVAFRRLAGQDMDVTAGTHHYPYGHEAAGCWKRYTYTAEGTWVEDHDFDFTHDPSHSDRKSDD